MSMVFERRMAVRALTQVLGSHVPLDDTLAQFFNEPELQDKPDSRAWLTDVCAGTLRWKGRLDLAIDAYATKKKPTGWLRKVLLVAAYQIIVQTRVAPAIVVDETVEMIKKEEGLKPAGFANALLRQLAQAAPMWRDLKYNKASPSEEQADWASMPEWLFVALKKSHGIEWVCEFAKACLERPQTWIRVRETGEPKLLEQGGAVQNHEGFKEGDFFVQDISSQTLVKEISAKLKALGKGNRVLDVCAAPGGKSVGLAWNGFDVTSSDKDDPTRMALLKQTAERVGGQKMTVVPQTALADLTPFDLVWVDAPCSGSGIIRRHPDVRWLKARKDVDTLVEIQRLLMKDAWTRVKPGGLFAYSVCSVIHDEGPGQVETFLTAHPEAKLLERWELYPHVAATGGGDGFWAALIQKP